MPCLIAGLKAAITEITIRPEPNETSAASIGFPIRCESSPLARACSAIITPEIAAKKFRRGLLLFTTYECRQIHAYLQSNPSERRERQRQQMLGG